MKCFVCGKKEIFVSFLGPVVINICPECYVANPTITGNVVVARDEEREESGIYGSTK